MDQKKCIKKKGIKKNGSKKCINKKGSKKNVSNKRDQKKYINKKGIKAKIKCKRISRTVWKSRLTNKLAYWSILLLNQVLTPPKTFWRSRKIVNNIAKNDIIRTPVISCYKYKFVASYD